MGAWGPGIFSNDIALEVKETYTNTLKLGATDDEAYENTKKHLSDYLNDDDDAIDFWLGLSSIQYKYGRLSADVQVKALNIIEKGDDYRWHKSEIGKRHKELSTLKEKICGPQPQRKVFKKAKPFICSCKPNDIFLFKLDSEELKNCYFYNWNCYILIDQVVNFDTEIEGLGDMFPTIYIKYSPNELKKIEDIDALDFVKTKGIDCEEHRLQLYNDGYTTFFNKCRYIGNYNFSRTCNIYENLNFIMEPPRTIIKIVSTYLSMKK